MILYQKDKIEIGLIEEKDIAAVLKLFETFDFNVTLDTGVKPTSETFRKIIQDNINNPQRTEAVFVLRKNGKCIAYLSCYVVYDTLVIGHISVDVEEQHQGYGKLLTLVAMQVAGNEARNVTAVCYYPNNYLKSLGFEKCGSSYFYRGNQEHKNLPKIFVSYVEYKEMVKQETDAEVQSFKDFLDSEFGQYLLKL